MLLTMSSMLLGRLKYCRVVVGHDERQQHISTDPLVQQHIGHSRGAGTTWLRLTVMIKLDLGSHHPTVLEEVRGCGSRWVLVGPHKSTHLQHEGDQWLGWGARHHPCQLTTDVGHDARAHLQYQPHKTVRLLVVVCPTSEWRQW